MNYLVLPLLMVSFLSCGHHHTNVVHHHHDDSASFPASDHGNGIHVIKHGGETYYFDSLEEQNKFEGLLKLKNKSTNCVRKGRQLICREN